MERPELTIVLGPTGVGKTDFAIDLALDYASPVVSCDSRQVFKELKIGTAPPSPEQLERVRHYFIFSHSIHNGFTAGLYEMEALSLLDELFKSHRRIVMAGGSGLYIDALCNGLDDFPPADENLRRRLSEQAESEGVDSLTELLGRIDPQTYSAIDLKNRQRVIRAVEVTLQTGKRYSEWRTNRIKERPFVIKKIGLTRERNSLYERIDKRVDAMMAAGLLEEADSLRQYSSLPALQTVGYREFFQYFNNEISLDKAVELVKRNSRRYAKKQLTYWRRDSGIEWMTLD